jgi:hypothetical protein
MQRLSEHLFSSVLVTNVGTSGYLGKALDWAPISNDSLHLHFIKEEIQVNIEEIISRQQEVGGWGITLDPLRTSCELE